MRILPAKGEYISIALPFVNKGYPIVLPTDTLYGICADATNQKAVEKIYHLKWRNPNKPLIVLIENLQWLEKFFHLSVSGGIEKLFLFEKPISVILPIKGFDYISRGSGKIAFRLVKKGFIKEFLKAFGKPIVAPSANWEGHPPAKTPLQAYLYFGDAVPVYFDGGIRIGNPSALIDLSDGRFNVLRKGNLTTKDLEILRTLRI